MRNISLALFLLSTACSHTGVRTMCIPQPNGQVLCRTRDFDAENREAVERDRAVRLNACIEGRSRTNPGEAFGEAKQRCEVSVAAQVAASTPN